MDSAICVVLCTILRIFNWAPSRVISRYVYVTYCLSRRSVWHTLYCVSWYAYFNMYRIVYRILIYIISHKSHIVSCIIQHGSHVSVNIRHVFKEFVFISVHEYKYTLMYTSTHICTYSKYTLMYIDMSHMYIVCEWVNVKCFHCFWRLEKFCIIVLYDTEVTSMRQSDHF